MSLDGSAGTRSSSNSLIPKLLLVALALLFSFSAMTAACSDGISDPSASPQATTTTADGEIALAPNYTATAVPISTSAPTVSPTASVTPIKVESASEVERLSDAAWDWLVDLTENLSPRASGTEEEALAADHLEGIFQSMGYQTTVQPFTFHTVRSTAGSLGKDAKQFRALPMEFSARGEVEGELVYVGLAQEGDIPELELTGKVALIERGITTFEEKVNGVAAAGAVGAVVYNNSAGFFRGSLGTDSAIPVVSVSGDDSHELLMLAADPSITFSLSILDLDSPSQNIIAEKPGSGNGVVVLGAHYDTVPNSPGANDNGSGVATLLTIADELADKTLPYTMRFLLFGAEEEGLHGSIHYVQNTPEEELDRLIAMLNFDALGSGPEAAVFGSAELAQTVSAYGDAHGINVGRRLSLGPFSSDHAPFADAGVPALFFMADDFSRINSPDDHIEFVEPIRMGEAAALALGALNDLATGR